jgi:hypothetical protein
MKLIKLSFIIAVAVLAIAGMSTTSYAFHDGGVAYCEGCHTMHNSLQGSAMTVAMAGQAGDATKSNKYLLQGADQSSTCLNCHGKGNTLSSYHISTQSIVRANNNAAQIPVQETPGGDFSWVKIGYQSTGATFGDRHGHNIIATDFQYASDSKNSVAPGSLTTPGGQYDAGQLTCISCHDPHASARRDSSGAIVYRTLGGSYPSIMASGSYGAVPAAGEAVGVYRFLGGIGYVPKSYAGGPTFQSGPPMAVAPSTYNRSEAASDTHVAYGSGMAQWCANCHTDFLNISSVGVSGHPHPAGQELDATVVANYNAYVKTGDLQGSNYWSLVPIEEGSTATYGSLATDATNTAGVGYQAATTSSVVMCLSCHRAHASAFNSMIRWYNNDSFITEDSAYVTSANGTAPNSTAQATKAYYDRPATNFAAFQRVLCNKCHAKD